MILTEIFIADEILTRLMQVLRDAPVVVDGDFETRNLMDGLRGEGLRGHTLLSRTFDGGLHGGGS